MVFFCHGTGSNRNAQENCPIRLNKKKNHAVRKIRARPRGHAVTLPNSQCTCTAHSKGHSLLQKSYEGSPQKSQEETETDEFRDELKEEGSLEQVPFEIIEAEDILFWGCPPHKIPRVATHPLKKASTRILLDKKAASFPKQCKCQQVRESWSERFEYEDWNDFYFSDFRESSHQSDHELHTKIPREFSWSSFNPFDEIRDLQESFNEIQNFLFPQLFKPSTSSPCQIYDIPFEDDKALVLLRPSKLRTSQRPIIEEYNSEDEESSGHRLHRRKTLDASSLKIIEMKSGVDGITKNSSNKDRLCSPTQTNVVFKGTDDTDSSNDESESKPVNGTKCCPDHMSFFDVRIMHSLPGIYTVCNVETETQKHPHRKRRRRKKAISVAITQCQQDLQPTEVEVIDNTKENTEIATKSNRKSAESFAKTEPAEKLEIGVGYSKQGSPQLTSEQTVELFKAPQLLSSSSKILPQFPSAVTIHLRSRSCPSIPSSGSLISFSPAESFVSSAEESPVKLNIEEEALARSQNDDPVTSLYKYPESSESIDGENFIKFYPPPTPITKPRRQSDSNSVVICNQVYLQFDNNNEMIIKESQKSVLKRTHGSKVSSVRFKVDQDHRNIEPDFKSIETTKLSNSASYSRRTTDDDLPEIVDIKFLQHGIPSVSSAGRDSFLKLHVPLPPSTKNIIVKSERSNSKSSLRKVGPNDEVVVPERVQEKPTIYKEDDSTEILIKSPVMQASSTSEKNSKNSSKPSTKIKRKGLEPKVSKKKVHQAKNRNLSPVRTSPGRSRRAIKLLKNTSSKNSSSQTDRSLSRESKKRNRRRKKQEPKHNLWQKMLKYFFGCKSKDAGYGSLHDSDSSTGGYYGGDYKPKISFFERIVIWWRKKTHRQIVVRQDSVQLFRIKRRQWLKEMHEFCEDLHTVNQNIREAEKKRRKKKLSRYTRHKVAKIVNSEGCVLLRSQGVRIDTLNGNKPKEKPGESTPVRGILKNSQNLHTKRITLK